MPFEQFHTSINFHTSIFHSLGTYYDAARDAAASRRAVILQKAPSSRSDEELMLLRPLITHVPFFTRFDIPEDAWNQVRYYLLHLCIFYVNVCSTFMFVLRVCTAKVFFVAE
jgi:hypothetical protein